ncbi:3-oxoadipate enol-lactonase [Pandoraea terrae]|uniref:3-oxoadipate enol-lactonase n=1 Tax=Pandoraea terrae TaxID=1537710 RepID=A0A5E4SM85_9BURK|nr:3-oxoadipate enol-lactonase [Pandoraea terrae]VVD76002.1 3-oxoadipate enol-lactonase [Pandoraea terrae]
MQTQKTIDVGDAALRVVIDGSQDAPVLLLSNSLGTTLEMWDPQMPALTRDFRVVRYDTRGHGSSSVTPGPYTIARLGRDAVALLDALDVERAHFAGVSMGGMTGMWLAMHAGTRLHSLIVACSSAHIGGEDGWNARIRAVQAGGMSPVVDAVVSRWFTEAYFCAAGDAIAHLKTMLGGIDPQGYAAACAAVRDMNLLPEIERIATPTLVIGGTQDLATPLAMSEAIVARIKGARLVTVPGAHLSNIECAEAFNAAATAFLSDVSGGARAERFIGGGSVRPPSRPHDPEAGAT